MFFKKLLPSFFIFCLPLASYSSTVTFFSDATCQEVSHKRAKSDSDFFGQFTCAKDIKNYYPALMKGQLDWPQQKRFFRCLHDGLELIVEKHIFIHDSHRDYFTKNEIFKMFHWYFKYDCSQSGRITDQLFAIKKLLIGGSIDRLKDKELADLYKLMYDYRDIYYILHREIPIFKKALTGEIGSLTMEETDLAMEQLRKAFILLERAYLREKIVYSVEDLNKYDQYLQQSGMIGRKEAQSVRPAGVLLKNLFEGLLFPEKAIYGDSWPVAIRSFYEVFRLLFHYKTHFSDDMESVVWTYRVLEGAVFFLSALGLEGTQFLGDRRGFPLRNLDKMLSVLFSFFDSSRKGIGQNSFWTKNLQSSALPLLTRTLTCFSLSFHSEKNCDSHWGEGPSDPVITLTFPDMFFKIFPNRVKTQRISGATTFINQRKLNFLKNWLVDYKDSLWRIHYGEGYELATERGFAHWLNSFFGWEPKSERIVFGSFHRPKTLDKIYQLFGYQTLLPLLFSSYLPNKFFSPNSNGKLDSISLKTWRKIVKEVMPALLIFSGGKGWKYSLEKSFIDMFHFADSFLISSNRDEELNSRELMDLTTYLLESIKTVRLAESKMPNCLSTKGLAIHCVVKKVLNDPDVLSVYPRFQKYLFPSQINSYREKMTAVLGGDKKDWTEVFSLLPLFILIQTMETNYNQIDTNQSFNLESHELAQFAKKFEEQLAHQIPFIFNKEQARSYLMYSFKTGDMPFFTGDRWTPLDFSHWHLNPKNQKDFFITANNFHFLIFDFYQLYQNL